MRAMSGKVCDGCGKPYYRANRLRLWTDRNPGHREGWRKLDEKLCLTCSDTRQTQRIVSVISIRPVSTRKRARG